MNRDAGVRSADGGSAAFCSALAEGESDAATLQRLLGSAAARCTLHASDYDRSCSRDSDCVIVGDGDGCTLPCRFLCANATINAAAQAEYQADFAKTPLGACRPLFCGCPCIGPPRCRDGLCEPTQCGPTPADAGG